MPWRKIRMRGKTLQPYRWVGRVVCGAIKGAVCGDPDMKHVSTSFVERQNLTMRMNTRAGARG